MNFQKVIVELKELNHQGPITIAREISGPQQLEDVKRERLTGEADRILSTSLLG